MKRDLISKATRNEFREVLVDFVLREIDMIFDGAGFSPDDEYDPQLGGARRTRVEQYYTNIDFSSPTHIKQVLSAYEDIIVRLERSEATATVNDLLRRMERDGYRYENGVFVQPPREEAPLIQSIRKYAISHNLEALRHQIDRLAQAAENDLPLAVGTSKEMVETICKTILQDRGISPRNEELPKLVRTTAKELLLLPDDIPDSAKGGDVIRRVLNSLNQVAQGLAELRNLYGTGHGHDGRFIGISPRHAKLAVGAATTLSIFLLETHLERTQQVTASQPIGRDLS